MKKTEYFFFAPEYLQFRGSLEVTSPDISSLQYARLRNDAEITATGDAAAS